MTFKPIYYRPKSFSEFTKPLSLNMPDGVKLEGAVYEPEEPTCSLLFFGGRSQDSVGLIDKLSLEYPHVRIITFNYRSYGKSEGKINEKNLFADSLHVAKTMREKYGDIYVMGFSLGSVVASFVASKCNVLGVFLIGTFDSVKNLMKSKYGLNLSWILRYKFDNISFVQDIDAKTYIFVSKIDEIAYIQNARNLKPYVKNLALFKEYDNLKHKELLWDKQVTCEIKNIIENTYEIV